MTSHVHPLTVAASSGVHPFPTSILAWLPEAALAALRRSSNGRWIALERFVRRDVPQAKRQELAEALAENMHRPPVSPDAVVLVLTDAIHRGRVRCTPALWQCLQHRFATTAKDALEKMERGDRSAADSSSREDYLAALAIAMAAKQLNLPVEPQEVATSLLATWRVVQKQWRDLASRHPSLLTYATPWEANAYTAHPPAAEDAAPWLLPPEGRSPRLCWMPMPSDLPAAVMWRSDTAYLEDLWPTLPEHIAQRTWPDGFLWHLGDHLVLPPMMNPTFDALLESLRTERRARDLAPLVHLAWAALRSEPTREVARVARALLRAQQRFPSLDARLRDMLWLLPLGRETHGIWWETASTLMGKGQKWRTGAFGAVQAALAAQRTAAGGDLSPWDEPSETVGVGDGTHHPSSYMCLPLGGAPALATSQHPVSSSRAPAPVGTVGGATKGPLARPPCRSC